ncbi:lachesin-like [Amphibalanus amphitrite]|uniref:lachesin-like n=1 Tax=Amphibalanus amphitrite TaxID=1232801 RepID=UPI001C907897|nr:lachesin-like [Amphibalanus amphitrite]
MATRLLARCYSAVLAASLLTAGGCGRSPLGRPSFAVPIDNQTVSLHRDVTLACVVHQLGEHKVAWLHLDRQSLISIGERLITQLPQFTVHHDRQKTWTLKIRNVKKEDGGVYMCQVNTEPMLTQEGTVTVVVPPIIVDNRSSPSEVTVHEGKSVRLTCHAEGQPAPAISWRREDNRPIYVNRPVLRHNSSSLELKHVSRKAMGAYLCIANNGVPPSPSKMITLKVKFPPSIRVETQLLGAPVGSSVRMVCHAEAAPNAMHYWEHEDKILLHNAARTHHIEEIVNGFRTTMTLTIERLSEPDFGLYKCVSKNPFGEAEETIRVYATRAAERPLTTPPRPPPPAPADRRPQRQHYNRDGPRDSAERARSETPESSQLPPPSAGAHRSTELAIGAALLATATVQLSRTLTRWH